MPRVLVVTASMGAGHVRVADELARRLREQGAHAEVVDMLAAAGPAGELLRRTYRMLLRRAPWVYDTAMRAWARRPGPFERLVTGGAAERALEQAVRTRTPDVVVSTYNLASLHLGRLAAAGRITAPVVTLVTDPGAHPYWVSRHAALHIAPLRQTADRLREMGAPRVAAAAPLLAPAVARAPGRDAARAALGLDDRRLVVVSAGSWAAGDVRRTATLLGGRPDLHVLALCGHDARLHAALADVPGVTPIGWTDEVPTILAAADVVVDNAGGLTCWEAIACRTPVVLFAPLPGHGRLNAAALAGAGLARVAGDADALVAAVSTPVPEPPLPAHWSAQEAREAREAQWWVLALAEGQCRAIA